jgi:RHS repeat-associated protein
VHVIHSDHLNTPRALANAQTQGGQPAETVVWRWKLNQQTATGSNAFGAQPAEEDPDGNGISLRFDLRFPGQQYDAATGVHYNYFRDYEPGTGRYVESDPVGLMDGPSTYSYVRQSPLTFIDRNGDAAAAAALCFIPGVGWVSCVGATITAGAIVIGCYATGACQAATNAAEQAIDSATDKTCPDEEKDDCKRVATDWELRQAGIDAHEVKKGLGSMRLFEICKCKSGGFAVKRKG